MELDLVKSKVFSQAETEFTAMMLFCSSDDDGEALSNTYEQEDLTDASAEVVTGEVAKVIFMAHRCGVLEPFKAVPAHIESIAYGAGGQYVGSGVAIDDNLGVYGMDFKELAEAYRKSLSGWQGFVYASEGKVNLDTATCKCKWFVKISLSKGPQQLAAMYTYVIEACTEWSAIAKVLKELAELPLTNRWVAFAEAKKL